MDTALTGRRFLSQNPTVPQEWYILALPNIDAKKNSGTIFHFGRACALPHLAIVDPCEQPELDEVSGATGV